MLQKERWRLKEYEELKFMELREKMLEDKGLPDLQTECEGILQKAKEISTKFEDFEKEAPEM